MRNPAISNGLVVDHKFAAVFDSVTQAEDTALALLERTSLAKEQITVIRPDDPRAAQGLEPESQGIWRTLVDPHVVLGIAGAVAGFVLFLVLYSADVAFITLNLVVSVIVLTTFGAVGGLLLAGTVTLRPNRMPYLVLAQSALRQGKYVITVHASSAEQLEEARKTLRSRGVGSIRIF